MSKCLPRHHSPVIIPWTLHTLRYWQDCEMPIHCPKHFLWFRMKFLSCFIYCIFKHSMGILSPVIHISSWLSGNTLSRFVMPVIFFTVSRRELCLFIVWVWSDCTWFKYCQKYFVVYHSGEGCGWVLFDSKENPCVVYCCEFLEQLPMKIFVNTCILRQILTTYPTTDNGMLAQ